MKPVEPTVKQCEPFIDEIVEIRLIGGPHEFPDVIPCPALICKGDMGISHKVRVLWQLNEIELAALAEGGALWITTWGGLPIHDMCVIDKNGEQVGRD